MANNDYKPSGKTYEIKSFEQLVNIINKDNFANLGMDFIKWAEFVALMAEEIRKDLPEYEKQKSNWELMNPSFIWIDDGKNDLDKCQMKVKETGEIITVSLKTN